MKVGIVSDTHGFFDPRLKELFAGTEAILHAGDVGSSEVLDQLRQISKVYAVRGNVDTDELNLPPSLSLQLGSASVEIRHQLPLPQTEMERWSGGRRLGARPGERRDAFLNSFHPATRVVIFGHSHKPYLTTLGARLFFNPGSAGKRRFSLPRSCGLLDVFPQGVRATILSLGQYNKRLPREVWLPAGVEVL